jgi:hypothetical protein
MNELINEVMTSLSKTRKISADAALGSKIPGRGGLNWLDGQPDPLPALCRQTNIYRKDHLGLPPLAPQDYVLKEVPLDKVTLMQSGEDYLNDSSRETAKHYYRVHVLGEESGYSGDFKPAIIDETGRLLDGHHRHAAHKLLGRKSFWCYVPKSVAKKL